MFLKGTVSRIGILNWQIFFSFFLCFKDVPMDSGLRCSWREVFYYPYLYSFVCNVSFFLLAAFMIFSLSLFLAFWLWYTLAYFSLYFLPFGFIKLLESVSLPWYHIWKKCRPFFPFKYFFLFIPPSLPFRDSNCILLVLFKLSHTHFSSLIFLFLYFILNTFYCYIFSFNNILFSSV